MLTNCTHATTALVSDMIRIYFSEFVNFEFTMCEMVPLLQFSLLSNCCSLYVAVGRFNKL